MSTPAKIKLLEGSWLVLKSAAPLFLQVFGTGPFVVRKRLERELILRGQQDFHVTHAEALKFYDLAPDLKIAR